jgi:hypothetical protein
VSRGQFLRFDNEQQAKEHVYQLLSAVHGRHVRLIIANQGSVCSADHML